MSTRRHRQFLRGHRPRKRLERRRQCRRRRVHGLFPVRMLKKKTMLNG